MSSLGYKSLYKVNLGRTNYKDTWTLQKKLVDLRFQGKIPDTLLVTEHNPVVTMGRGTAKGNLLVTRAELAKRGVELFQIERGGDITFHGPGQLVLYPIVDLTSRGRDLHKYLRDLEEVVIITLNEFDLKATLKKGLTGVWVDNHKLAAIGVAVSHWVSYHGLALNVNTDLDYFKLINPCGITHFPVGSIASMLGKEVDFEGTVKLLAENFARHFGYQMKTITHIDSITNELAVA